MAQIGLELRDRALDRLRSSHAAFHEHVIGIIRGLPSGCEFTTDELWKACELPTAEPRAMGAAIRDASFLGLIESTHAYRRSTRAACHARPVLIWRRR